MERDRPGRDTHRQVVARLRHAAYAAGWFEPLWDLVIRAKQASRMLPVLETILSEFGQRPSRARSAQRAAGAGPLTRPAGPVNPRRRCA